MTLLRIHAIALAVLLLWLPRAAWAGSSIRCALVSGSDHGAAPLVLGAVPDAEREAARLSVQPGATVKARPEDQPLPGETADHFEQPIKAKRDLGAIAVSERRTASQVVFGGGIFGRRVPDLHVGAPLLANVEVGWIRGPLALGIRAAGGDSTRSFGSWTVRASELNLLAEAAWGGEVAGLRLDGFLQGAVRSTRLRYESGADRESRGGLGAGGVRAWAGFPSGTPVVFLRASASMGWLGSEGIVQGDSRLYGALSSQFGIDFLVAPRWLGGGAKP